MLKRFTGLMQKFARICLTKMNEKFINNYFIRDIVHGSFLLPFYIVLVAA